MEKEMLLTVIPSHPDLRYLGIQSECRYDVLCANKPSSLCILSQNLCRSFPHVTPGILAAAVGYSTCARFLLSYQLVTADCVFWGTSHYLFGYTNISIFFFFFSVNKQNFNFMETKMHSKSRMYHSAFFVCCFLCAALNTFHYSFCFPEKIGEKNPQSFSLVHNCQTWISVKQAKYLRWYRTLLHAKWLWWRGAVSIAYFRFSPFFLISMLFCDLVLISVKSVVRY